MQDKNVLNKFKLILGEYCAINQFVELSKRSFLADHSSALHSRDEFVQLANNNSISLTCYDPDKMVHSISLSYIVNVQLCFETFLKELYQHSKLYGQNTFQEKKQDDSWLKCVCRSIYQETLPSEMIVLYDLCEYYRLVRNNAVHDLCEINTHSSEYNKLKKYDFKTNSKFARLIAPNTYDNLSFDDFVMFSRSCVELATHLFETLEYDYKKIIVTVLPRQIVTWRRLHNRQRCENAIHLYIKTSFKDSDAIKSQLAELYALVMAHSSNG